MSLCISVASTLFIYHVGSVAPRHQTCRGEARLILFRPLFLKLCLVIVLQKDGQEEGKLWLSKNWSPRHGDISVASAQHDFFLDCLTSSTCSKMAVFTQTPQRDTVSITVLWSSGRSCE